MISAETQIRNYIIDEEIGRGAFGVVFKGHLQNDPTVSVAIKVLENTGNLERQMAEPEMLSRLQHPNIVRLREYFVHQDQLVIVLDYISGGDLKTAIDNGRKFSQEEVKALLESMASALAYAHHRNIVHRDIKLANIMLEEANGELRFILTDFGIGRVSEGVQDRPNTGGTFLFMAPEQFRGRPVPQSDLWAVGVVAYFLLSGKMPFAGNSLQDLSRSILYTNPVAPSIAAAKPIDEKLDMLVTQLLAKSLNERIASAEDLLRLLGSKKNDLLGTSSILLNSGGSIINAFVGSQKERATTSSGMDSVVRKLRRQQRTALTLTAIFGIFIAFGSGVIAGVATTVGLILFYLSQTRLRQYKYYLIIAACVFFAVSWANTIRIERKTTTTTTSDEEDEKLEAVDENIGIVKEEIEEVKKEVQTAVRVTRNKATSGEITRGILKFLGQISYPLFAISIASHRRLSRQISNCSLLIQDPSTTPDYLEQMKRSVAERPSDILFRLKYVEAMLAENRLEDVIVECQLILEIDPYNFSANLLLANALVEFGFFEDAGEICKEYLAISGYCFEFQMLLERCRNQGALL